jgi:predicted nucleic acid-binding protein
LQTLAIYDKAARLFYHLRRHGVTVRKSVDVLIALTAIENGVLLLHDDRDFAAMAKWEPKLKLLESL